jgi:hypothetical protein
MTEESDRGYAAMLYLMNRRGQALRDDLPEDHQGAALVEGLCSSDRTVRAKWLARCLGGIMSDLKDRELS